MGKVSRVKTALRVVPRPVRGLILALAGLLIITGVALAAVVLFIVIADMSIIPGEQAAEVYMDPECTVPVPAVHWGSIQRGTHQQLDFYIKNTGVEPIDCSIIIPEDVSAVMTYSFTPTAIHLEAGQVGHVVWEADILLTAPFGDSSWTYQGETP